MWLRARMRESAARSDLVSTSGRGTVDAPLLDAVVEAEVLVKVLGDAHEVAHRQAAPLERAVAQLEQLFEGEADCGRGPGQLDSRRIRVRGMVERKTHSKSGSL